MNNTQQQQNTQDTQQQVSALPSTPQQAQVPTDNQQTGGQQQNINQTQEGFNLIPALTKEEKVKIKKKNTFNISSILSIIVLASIAIAIVGFNILTKAQLSSKKNSLARIERRIYEDIDKITSNNAILERVKLYERFKKGSFSHKRIIEFLRDMADVERGNKRGRIAFTSIEIMEDLTFKVSGVAPNLEQVAYLWYILGVNESLESISLASVGKTDEGARFSFEGKLIISNFSNE